MQPQTNCQQLKTNLQTITDGLLNVNAALEAYTVSPNAGLKQSIDEKTSSIQEANNQFFKEYETRCRDLLLSWYPYSGSREYFNDNLVKVLDTGRVEINEDGLSLMQSAGDISYFPSSDLKNI